MPPDLIAALYDWPTWLIIVGLLALMLVSNEVGFRFGMRDFRRETEVSRTVSNALKGSIFGLVALLLGFSFSATTSRYDLRQRIVLDQANAVGTCYLRAQLLSDEHSDAIQGVLRKYVDERIDLFDAGRDADATAEHRTRIKQYLTDLWTAVETANDADPEVVRNSMIVSAANDVIDLSSTRDWANHNHLPDPVLALLLVSVVMSSLLLGHSSGQSGRRHPGLWLASNVVFGLVLFVVLDFDRPRRGLIQIDQRPLLELRESLAPSERNS